METIKSRRRINRTRAAHPKPRIIKYEFIFCSACRHFSGAKENFAAMMREIFGVSFCAGCWNKQRVSGGVK